ncbi:MAG: hypothetical protein GY756_17845 [bacterium]|nr:hypothetical protein [bacterium]
MKIELLKQERDLLQGIILKQNDIIFKIKGWSITLFSALVFFAADKNKLSFLIISTFAVMLFLLLDATYSHIQRIFINKSRKVQQLLQSENLVESLKSQSLEVLLLAGEGESLDIDAKTKFIGILNEIRLFHNSFLYLIMFVLNACLALYLW